MKERDDIRPRGSIEVPCSGPACRWPDGGDPWRFWVEALDPRLPAGPFICPRCEPLSKFEVTTGRRLKAIWGPAATEAELIAWFGEEMGKRMAANARPDELRPILVVYEDDGLVAEAIMPTPQWSGTIRMDPD